MYLLCQRAPGFTADFLEKMPYYEFMEYAKMLNEEIKKEQEQVQQQKMQQNEKFNTRNAAMRKLQKIVK